MAGLVGVSWQWHAQAASFERSAAAQRVAIEGDQQTIEELRAQMGKEAQKLGELGRRIDSTAQAIEKAESKAQRDAGAKAREADRRQKAERERQRIERLEREKREKREAPINLPKNCISAALC